ncbi:MAG: hydrogenase 3 maturation endopeptidase HyCI [Anaerolineales bacterium]|nr:MAG: hydrogenase 3 maturation endopeptidase HyCI [Anaerolineales bacterium]
MDRNWDVLLGERLGRLRKTTHSLRVAVIGIGHELQGDDAAGVLIARYLQSLIEPSQERLILCAGPAPENCCGALRRFAPDLVLMIDAAQMDEVPGTVQLIPYQDVTGVGASTHTLPLHILGRYLKSELGCEITLLGIQPAFVEFGEISPLMQKVVPAIAQRLAIVLGGELGEGANHGRFAMNTSADVLIPAGVKAHIAKSEQGTT